MKKEIYFSEIRTEWNRGRVVVAEVRVPGTTKTLRCFVHGVTRQETPQGANGLVKTIEGNREATKLFSFDNFQQANSFIKEV
jgi:hypothetical protein